MVLLYEEDKLYTFVWCYMIKFIHVMRMVIRYCLPSFSFKGVHNLSCLCPFSNDLQKLLLTEYEWHSLCCSCMVYISYETQMAWLQSSHNQISEDNCAKERRNLSHFQFFLKKYEVLVLYGCPCNLFQYTIFKLIA